MRSKQIQIFPNYTTHNPFHISQCISMFDEGKKKESSFIIVSTSTSLYFFFPLLPSFPSFPSFCLHFSFSADCVWCRGFSELINTVITQDFETLINANFSSFYSRPHPHSSHLTTQKNLSPSFHLIISFHILILR